MKKVTLWALVMLTATCMWAQRLPDTVIPSHYQLSFEPDLKKAAFAGTEKIDVEIAKATNAIVLNAVDLTFERVVITQNGATQEAKVSFDPKAEMATLTVEKPLAAGPAQIEITFSGKLNDQLRGFYLSKSKERNYAVTQFEATDARWAFPSFDEPAMKATFDIRLTIDQGDTAISNGKIVRDEPGPGAGKHTLTFSTTPKMSTYLVAMAVGDFECIAGSADEIPIRVCDVPGRKHLLKFALEAAEANLKYFDQYYAIRYPFGKLDVIAFPDFSAGAMENTAAITYRETLLAIDDQRASVGMHRLVTEVLSHEMAHQWFGDLVTMKWWDDVWLNEGFATWMAPKPVAVWKPEWRVEMEEVKDTARAMNLDSLATTRAIRNPASSAAEISQQFDAIAYEKAAAVLRMVESYLGEETFREGVNAYLKEHAYGNATSEDFWNTLTRVSKKPADKVMSSFVIQPGVPVVNLASKCEGGSTVVTLSQERFAYNPAVTEKSDGVWQIPVCLKTPGSSPRCELMTEKRREVTLKGCASYVYGNADARGYYRTGYDSATLRRISKTAEKDLNGPERAQLVNDAWAMVRAGRSNAEDFLAMIQGLDGEREYGVMSQEGTYLRYVSDYLITDTDRSAYEAWVRNLLHPLAEDLGYRTAPNDSDDTKQLRASVLLTLGYAGRDPKVLAVAREMTEQALERSEEVDPSLFGSMVKVAAMHGDAALYDKIAAKLNDSKLPPNEYDTWMYALTEFRDPKLLQRTLRYIAGPDVRNQDAGEMVGAVWENPAGMQPGWEFVKANWPQLNTKFATYSHGEIAGGTRTFCDAGLRDEVKSFFSQHAPDASRIVNRALESIDNCVRLKQQQEPRLDAWLKGKGAAAGQP